MGARVYEMIDADARRWSVRAPDASYTRSSARATLSCDRACPAADTIRNAGGIVFGYESSGVPPSLARAVGGWVQIPSRSSINVVASMSIIFASIIR